MENIKLEYIPRKKEEIKKQIEALEVKPKLVIIQVGNVPASCAYVKGKLKDCAEVGLPAELIHLEETITEEELHAKIEELNHDDSVTGFIVQLPLPKHIHEQMVIEAIDPLKDVDGFSKRALVNPGTPQGIIDYLEANNFKFQDANAVVIGRSNIVGRPMARLLLDRSCNVSVIHSKTSEHNKRNLLKEANLVVVATGHRNTLTNEDLTWREYYGDDWNDSKYYDEFENNECFIVDVGMNKNDDGKLCGDCEAVTVCEKTPVPGGVGLLTRLALIVNLLKLYKIQKA